MVKKVLRSQNYGFILNYIALHSLDPELVKMTVGSGICHKYKSVCAVQLKFSHKKKQWLHMIKKYIHIYRSIQSTCAISTTFKLMSHF
jgi:hypothetical protein